jgi:anti-sigma regulatory factor (Ser/Thr protein kinase)
LPGGSPQRAFASLPYAQADDLAAVRGFVRSRALALGMSDNRVKLLASAVNELATNTLQHAAGGGQVRLWTEEGHLVCDVADVGPVPPIGQMPPPDSVRGRGLAIVARVVDEVTTVAVLGGTAVRIRMALIS